MAVFVRPKNGEAILHYLDTLSPGVIVVYDTFRRATGSELRDRNSATHKVVKERIHALKTSHRALVVRKRIPVLENQLDERGGTDIDPVIFEYWAIGISERTAEFLERVNKAPVPDLIRFLQIHRRM
jgi:hypothetical protein